MVTFLRIYAAQHRIPHLHRELNSPKLYRFQYSLCTLAPRFQIDTFPPALFYICAIHAGRTRYVCSNHVGRQVSRFRNCANSDRDHIMCRTCDPKDWRTKARVSFPDPLTAAHPFIAYICATRVCRDACVARVRPTHPTIHG